MPPQSLSCHDSAFDESASFVLGASVSGLVVNRLQLEGRRLAPKIVGVENLGSAGQGEPRQSAGAGGEFEEHETDGDTLLRRLACEVPNLRCVVEHDLPVAGEAATDLRKRIRQHEGTGKDAPTAGEAICAGWASAVGLSVSAGSGKQVLGGPKDRADVVVVTSWKRRREGTEAGVGKGG